MNDDLNEIVQLVGKNALSETEKLILDISKLIIEDFLQQNGYSDYDSYCHFVKTRLMLRNIIDYFEKAQKIINCTRKTWANFKTHTEEIFYALMKMKFIAPHDDIEAKLEALHTEMCQSFEGLKGCL